MFVWILILSPWVALLSLILHDATKDSDGSAISIAAKKIRAFVFWTQKSESKPPVATAVEAISSSSKPSGPKKKGWRKGWRQERRVSMTTPELELAIAEAVKKAAPGCEDFVGVIVRRETPKFYLDPNWAIRGVRFGIADRKIANEALATVVERMKREFLLSDD